MSYTFADLITHEALQEYAGKQVYQRGVAYWRDGLVSGFRAGTSEITASVMGTDCYDVELWLEADGLEANCDCMGFEDGEFCKHCVAVGLTWLEKNSPGGDRSKSVPRGRQKNAASRPLKRQKVDLPETYEEFAADLFEEIEQASVNKEVQEMGVAEDLQQLKLLVMLMGMPPPAMAEIILEQASIDPAWRDRLFTKFQPSGNPTIEVLPRAVPQKQADPRQQILPKAVEVVATPEMAWADFVKFPNPTAYQKLKVAADRLGNWHIWKEKAIAHFRGRLDEIDRRIMQSGRSFGVEPGREVTMLVNCLLGEGDGQRALQEAKQGHCERYTWLRLAEQIRKSQPEEALSIYMMSITAVMQEANTAAYQEVYRLLKIIQELMLGLELRSQFRNYVLSLEQKYKAKRSFVAGLQGFK